MSQPRVTLSRIVVASLALVSVMLRTAPAQADEGEVWLSAGADVELHERLRLGGVQHLRFGSGRVEALTDVDAVVPVRRWFRLGAGYRLGVERGDATRVFHRLHVDGHVRTRLGRVRVRIRGRYQARIAGNTRHTFRLRLRLRLHVTKWFRPFAVAETFVRTSGLRKQRLGGGLLFAIDDHRIRLVYLLELPLGGRDAERTHVAGMHYRFGF